MTAVADPRPGKLETFDDVKIAYLDRAKKTIRLIFLAGVDKGHNQEYNYSNADVDSRIRTGDAPIECIRHGETLISLKFKPGMEPAQSAGAPVSQAKSVEPAKPQEETPKAATPKEEQKPAAPQGNDGKWQIALLKKEGNRALIRTNNGKEEWFNFSGKAAEKIIRLKDGQLVKIRFENSTTFNDINPVDENGQYDKSAWGGGSGGSGGEKRGGRTYDPTVDLIRNLSILHEAVFDKAEKFSEFCLLNNVPDDKRSETWKWIKQTAIDSSAEIYGEIEKKYKINGGQS